MPRPAASSRVRVKRDASSCAVENLENAVATKPTRKSPAVDDGDTGAIAAAEDADRIERARRCGKAEVISGHFIAASDIHDIAHAQALQPFRRAGST